MGKQGSRDDRCSLSRKGDAAAGNPGATVAMTLRLYVINVYLSVAKGQLVRHLDS